MTTPSSKDELRERIAYIVGFGNIEDHGTVQVTNITANDINELLDLIKFTESEGYRRGQYDTLKDLAIWTGIGIAAKDPASEYEICSEIDRRLAELSPPDNTKQSEGLTEKGLEEAMVAVDKVTEHCDEHNTDYIGGCPFCQITKQENQI